MLIVLWYWTGGRFDTSLISDHVVSERPQGGSAQQNDSASIYFMLPQPHNQPSNTLVLMQHCFIIDSNIHQEWFLEV